MTSYETQRNGTGSKSKLTTRQAWKDRLKNSRPIVEVKIKELATSDDPDGLVLMRAMGLTRKEEWGIRKLLDQQYEPDDERRNAQEREQTWRDRIEGQKSSLVAESIVDETGRTIFSTADMDELGEGNSAALERLYAKAVQLNGLTRRFLPDYLVKWLEEDETPAVAQPNLEARVRDFPSGRSNASSSDLPRPSEDHSPTY